LHDGGSAAFLDERQTGGAVAAIRECLETLEVDATRMRANMRDDLYGERDAFGLEGDYLGAAESFVDDALAGA
jgi:hypothetical protein